MIELNHDELASLKAVELEILKEFSRICKKYNLKYSLTGGTLLGAVRHKGFIPWDDDIDIVMHYDDYVLFLEYAKKELSNKFYVNNIYTDPHFGYLPMSKIMAHNTEMIEIPAKDTKSKKGIFIDIFPLYNTSNNSWIRKMDFKVIQRLSKNLRCRNGYKYNKSPFHNFIYNIRSFIYKIIPLSIFKKCFELIIKKNINNKSSKYIVSYAGVYDIDKEIFPREWFDEYIDIEFEGYNFPAMKLWDPYLENHYGNYMKLPPKEKRIPHHFLVKYKNNFLNNIVGENMKKIGIVSVDANTPMFNYGAILHTWAFEQYLEKNGYKNFETLNYYPEAVEYQNRIFPIIDLFTNCHRKLSLKYCIYYFQYLKKYKVIKRFIDNHMHLSQKKYRYSTINKQKLDYDILIAEDDVIWAPKFLCRKELVDKTFFLAHENMNCKKIAYAPSMAQCNFKPEEYDIIKSYLKDFEHIAVRETYEQKFINNNLNIKVDQCLDAVFLLDKEDYMTITSNKYKERKFVFVYLPADNNIKLRVAAKKYAEEKGLEVIEITNQICSSKNVYGDAGVEDFLSAIYYSDSIFTNSFHAICFSIIFEKQFYAFTRENSGKLNDICNLFSLNDRFCYDEVITKKKINYNQLNKIVKEKSEYSRQWILNAIEK